MTSGIFNRHEFNLETKSFQELAINQAMTQAKEAGLKEGTPASRINFKAYAICKGAYEFFEKEIKRTFPDEAYQTLITLTLRSRENLFHIELKDRVKKVLKGEGTS